jgi:uncharacterized protein
MPRRKRGRRMLAPPVVKGMSVTGIRGRRSQEIILLLEEYETIRLLDYQGMTQEEAAKHMEVSRPTLTRIYENARRKVACAFVEGRGILIRGGDFFFDTHWFKCSACKASFSSYEQNVEITCPVCHSNQLISLNDHYKNEI